MIQTTTELKQLLGKRQITAIVHRMTAEIRRNSKGGPPVFIGIPKGAFVFLADLIRTFGQLAEMDFVRISTC